MEDLIRKIALKNKEIEYLIEQILKNKTDYIKSYRGRYSFDTPIDKIMEMEMEMKKTIWIYLLIALLEKKMKQVNKKRMMKLIFLYNKKYTKN